MKALVLLLTPLITLMCGVWLGMSTRPPQVPSELKAAGKPPARQTSSIAGAPVLPTLAVISPQGGESEAHQPTLSPTELDSIRYAAKNLAEGMAKVHSLSPFQQAQLRNRIEMNRRRQVAMEAEAPRAARAALRAVLTPEQFNIVEDTIREDQATSLTQEIEARLSHMASQLGLEENQKDRIFAWLARKMDPSMQATIPGSPVLPSDELSLEQGFRQLMTAEQQKRLEQIPSILRHLNNITPRPDIKL